MAVDLAPSFAQRGFALLDGVLTQPQCEQVLAHLASGAGPGTRNTLGQVWCQQLARQLRQYSALQALLPPTYRAIQCTYFEKSVANNWVVSVHQDQSVPVAQRVEHPALQAWSEKEGQTFVRAPQDLLDSLVAVRLHLDPCTVQDGPLRVFAGSHTLGRVDADQAAQLKSRYREHACVAAAGTALVMRPLLLHASSKASGSSLRRVLHFLLAPELPPYGLQWRSAF